MGIQPARAAAVDNGNPDRRLPAGVHPLAGVLRSECRDTAPSRTSLRAID